MIFFLLLSRLIDNNVVINILPSIFFMTLRNGIRSGYKKKLFSLSHKDWNNKLNHISTLVSYVVMQLSTEVEKLLQGARMNFFYFFHFNAQTRIILMTSFSLFLFDLFAIAFSIFFSLNVKKTMYLFLLL